MNESEPTQRAPDYSQFVPFTARMMAAMRARESSREDRLFEDPFAATLAGQEAFAQVDQRLTPDDQTYVAVRTRCFDDLLAQTQGYQVVLLASGLDTRAYRLAWGADVDLYELDYPEVLAYKTAHLDRVLPPCNHHLIGADLTQPWEDKLLAAGYRPALPSVWVMEGLLMYLSAAQVHTLLQSVANLSAVGSKLGMDLVNLKSLSYGAYKGYFQFGCDTPAALLSAYGWQADVLQPGDVGANFGRYPKADSARDVLDVGRVFLIKAKKT